MSAHDPNRTAPDEVVERARAVAGDGTVDERCRRLLDHYAQSWWGVPHDESRAAVEDVADEPTHVEQQADELAELRARVAELERELAQ